MNRDVRDIIHRYHHRWKWNNLIRCEWYGRFGQYWDHVSDYYTNWDRGWGGAPIAMYRLLHTTMYKYVYRFEKTLGKVGQQVGTLPLGYCIKRRRR